MILLPESIRKQIIDIIRAMGSGATEVADGSRQLQALDPEHPLPYVFLGQEQKDAGNLDAAEELYWKGLERGPSNYTFYLGLSEVIRERSEESPLGAGLQILGL